MNGKSVIMTVPGNSQVAHSVSVKSAWVKQVTKVNGKQFSSMSFKIFDPAVTNHCHLNSAWINKNVISVFSIGK